MIPCYATRPWLNNQGWMVIFQHPSNCLTI